MTPPARVTGTFAPSTGTILKERVKELTCLYAIAQISGKPNAALPDRLQGVANILPTAWQRPKLASVRITLDGMPFNSKRRLCPGPHQKASLIVRGVCRGLIQIGYPPSPQDEQKLIFLDEEQRLLDEVARQVSLMVDHKETAAE